MKTEIEELCKICNKKEIEEYNDTCSDCYNELEGCQGELSDIVADRTQFIEGVDIITVTVDNIDSEEVEDLSSFIDFVEPGMILFTLKGMNKAEKLFKDIFPEGADFEADSGFIFD